MIEASMVDSRAAELRAEFDRAFARLPGADTAELLSLLTIRLAGHPYALRVSEVAAVLVDRRVTALPTTAPHLLGLVGIRGSIVPVYDLAAMLGHRASAASRWLVTAAAAPIALAVEQFEGLVSVNADRATVAETGAPAGGTIDIAGVTRSLIALAPLIDTLAVTGQQLHVKGDPT